MKITSTLTTVYQEFVQIQDLTQAKQFISNYVQGTKVKDTDKKKMIIEIDNCRSLYKLQYYITNALLKFEGLGVC